MTKKKILILGPSSQIGKSLLEEDASFIEFIEAPRAKIDLEHLNLIKEFIVSHNPDIVINCAAYTNVDLAERERSLCKTINSEAVGEMIKGCNETRATFIHFSTDYIYDGEAKNPYLESSEPHPLSYYGKSKLSGDSLIEKFCDNYLIFRISWIYGIYNNNFLKAIYKKIINGENLRVVNDQIGSPTSSGLVAKTIIHIIENYDISQKKEVLNLQPKGSASWFEFANFIKDNLDNPESSVAKISPVNSEAFISKAVRPKYSLLNTLKLEEIFQIQLNYWQDYALKEIKRLTQNR